MLTTNIAATAVIDKDARIGADVAIGPGCVVAAGAIIGDGCELKANVVVAEGVILGANNRLFQNTVLGEEPQMLDQEKGCTLVIGDNNVFRENVTVNRSTEPDGETTIGSGCYIMAGTHIGHDCDIEDEVVISNYTQLAGFVRIERKAWLGSLCGFHQFTTVGRFAYVGGMSAIGRDVPPFVRAAGSYPFTIQGVNAVGLQRAGFCKEDIQAIQKVYLQLFKRRNNKVFTEVLNELMNQPQSNEHVQDFLHALHRSTQHRLGRFRELTRV